MSNTFKVIKLLIIQGLHCLFVNCFLLHHFCNPFLGFENAIFKYLFRKEGRLEAFLTLESRVFHSDDAKNANMRCPDLLVTLGKCKLSFTEPRVLKLCTRLKRLIKLEMYDRARMFKAL